MKVQLQKMVGAVTACLMCVTASAVPFTVSAASYDSRDVDRNGALNVFDSIELQNYLCGQKATSTLNNIDVDGNNIVDIADVNCILASLVGSDYSNQVGGSASVFSAGTRNSSIASASGSQKYARYKYSTKTTTDYLLKYGTSNSTSNQVSTYTNKPGIIGADTRTEDALSGMVFLTNGGTGFIVGDHVIATSAHCVYDIGSTSWVTNYQIRLYDNDGNPTNTFLNPVEVHIPIQFYNGNKSDVYDYALIVVEDDLSPYYHYNLGMPYDMYTNDIFSEYAIYTTGFSQTIPGGNSNSNPRKMYTGVGDIVNISNPNKNLLYFDCDVTYGNSGGPVYVKEKYKVGSTTTEVNVVISICSGMNTENPPLYNCGPTMNAQMLRFYKDNEEVKALFKN